MSGDFPCLFHSFNKYLNNNYFRSHSIVTQYQQMTNWEGCGQLKRQETLLNIIYSKKALKMLDTFFDE